MYRLSSSKDKVKRTKFKGKKQKTELRIQKSRLHFVTDGQALLRLGNDPARGGQVRWTGRIKSRIKVYKVQSIKFKGQSVKAGDRIRETSNVRRENTVVRNQ